MILPKLRLAALVAAVCMAVVSGPHAAPSVPESPVRPSHVQSVPLLGTVNPASSELLQSAITDANRDHREAVLIEIDTPGGLESSMRDMVKAILKSEVPVIAYVSPAGARSASAGVFLMAASQVAAMAPGTNLGAAHPVGIGGGSIDSIMSGKITNDASAYMRSLARQRGRNVQWYEDAVRHSVSASETEALDKGLIDIVSRSREDLLDRLDGRRVTLGSGKVVTLHTRGAVIIPTVVSLRIKILNALSDPNIAYLLMLLGFYGILFELMHPGAVLPGVAGGVSLLLAFFALQTLPVNYVGMLLILFSLVLFILEARTPTHGTLGIGGVISFLLGSVMLLRVHGSELHVAWGLIAGSTAITALFFGTIIAAAFRARRLPVTTGKRGLMGERGRVTETLSPLGTVYVHGAYWTAEADEPLPKGTLVRVAEVKGLTLRVVRA